MPFFVAKKSWLNVRNHLKKTYLTGFMAMGGGGCSRHAIFSTWRPAPL